MVAGRELTNVPEHVFSAAADAEVHIVDFSKNKLTSIPTGYVRKLKCLSIDV